MGEGEDVGRLPVGPSVSLHGLLSGGRPGRKEAPLWLCLGASERGLYMVMAPLKVPGCGSVSYSVPLSPGDRPRPQCEARVALFRMVLRLSCRWSGSEER